MQLQNSVSKSKENINFWLRMEDVWSEMQSEILVVPLQCTQYFRARSTCAYHIQQTFEDVSVIINLLSELN